MKQILIRVDDDLHTRIKMICAEFGLTIQEFGESALGLEIERVEAMRDESK